MNTHKISSEGKITKTSSAYPTHNTMLRKKIIWSASVGSCRESVLIVLKKVSVEIMLTVWSFTCLSVTKMAKSDHPCICDHPCQSVVQCNTVRPV